MSSVDLVRAVSFRHATPPKQQLEFLSLLRPVRCEPSKNYLLETKGPSRGGLIKLVRDEKSPTPRGNDTTLGIFGDLCNAGQVESSLLVQLRIFLQALRFAQGPMLQLWMKELCKCSLE